MFRAALLGRWHPHSKKEDERYLKEFVNLPDCEIACVWDKDPETAEKWGAEHGFEVETDLERVLSRDDVDGVIVTSEPALHREIFIAAANHKKHIFTEKVLALTLEDAQAIREAVERNGVNFCISFYRLNIPQIAYAKTLIENGMLGRPVMFRCMCGLNLGLIDGALPEYWFNPDICGGGAMIDLGFNAAYVAKYIMGDMESVSAVFSNEILKERAEDSASCSVRFKNGAIGTIDATHTSPSLGVFEIAVYGTAGAYYARLGGSDLAELHLSGQNSKMLSLAELPKSPAAPVIQAWVEACTKGGSDELYGIDAAVDMVKFMIAVYQSEKEGGKRVNI